MTTKTFVAAALLLAASGTTYAVASDTPSSSSQLAVARVKGDLCINRGPVIIDGHLILKAGKICIPWFG